MLAPMGFFLHLCLQQRNPSPVHPLAAKNKSRRHTHMGTCSLPAPTAACFRITRYSNQRNTGFLPKMQQTVSDSFRKTLLHFNSVIYFYKNNGKSESFSYLNLAAVPKETNLIFFFTIHFIESKCMLQADCGQISSLFISCPCPSPAKSGSPFWKTEQCC